MEMVKSSTSHHDLFTKNKLVVIIISQVLAVALLFQSVLGGGGGGGESPPKQEPQFEAETFTTSAQYDRLVIFMVDALRADMISDRTEMRFVRRLLSKRRIKGYLSRAHAPTVTLPRIKALMSGSVPQFLDLVTNLAATSSSSDEDSLIGRLVKHGKHLVLLGDDTWLKLFPQAFLNRSDGTTSSFFTPDFVEVDLNVTRHIPSDFDPKSAHKYSTDWDVSILHYLGLDHVGHQLGPSSLRMSQKLQEMDETFQRVYLNLAEQDRLRNTKTLLVLMSDHGMNGAGNHGGSSFEEVSAVALFCPLPIASHSSDDIVPQGRIPLEEAFQVDVAPTLGLVLGVGIPSRSLGCPLSGAFLTDESFQQGSALNKQHLLRILQDDAHHTSSCLTIQAELLARSIRQDVASSGVMFKQTLCLLVLLFALLAQHSTLVRYFSPFSVFVLVISILSLASSSAIENEHATVFHLFATYCWWVSTRKNWKHVLIMACLARLARSRLEIINFARLANTGTERQFLNQGTGVLPTYFGYGEDPASQICAMLVVHAFILWQLPSSMLERIMMALPVVCTWRNFFHPSVGYAKLAFYGYLALSMLGLFMKRYPVPGKENKPGISVFSLALMGLATLLHRPSNLPVLATGILLIFALCSSTHNIKRNDLVAIFFLIGFALFFALGNSHAVSTIDISGGYVGSDEYSRERVALLTTFTVYTGPIVACLACLDVSDKQSVVESLWMIQSVRLVFASFMTVLMQNHLFIWSVFAPRFVYEMLWTLCLLVIVGTSRLTIGE